MIKGKASFEMKIGERNYLFLCENNSPAGEVYDVLGMIRSEVFKIIQDDEERSRKQEEKSEKPRGGHFDVEVCENCKNSHCDCEADPDFK